MPEKNKQIFTFFCQEKLRLDDFLRSELSKSTGEEFSNSKLRRMIIAGAVYVNDRSVNRPAFELRGKSKITVHYDREKFFYEKQPDDIKFEVTDKDVLYETDGLIFINKPAFFPVEQTIVGNRNNLHDAVVNYLWARNKELRNPPYAGIMHRLDRETSGVILFTKNREMNKAVSQMFQGHNFEKKYLAVVEEGSGRGGAAPGKIFTVEKFMGRVSGKSQAGKWGSLPESKGGLYSKTTFTILKEIIIEEKRCFLVQCNLFTGRTHQIRVHLSESGLPILGDELYGGKSAKRIYLHAEQLIANTEDLKFKVTAPIEW